MCGPFPSSLPGPFSKVWRESSLGQNLLGWYFTLNNCLDFEVYSFILLVSKGVFVGFLNYKMDIINNDITNIINNQIESEKSNNENATGEPDDDEEDEKPIEILIQNIVATVNLGCTVDLEKIAQTARNAGGWLSRFI